MAPGARPAMLLLDLIGNPIYAVSLITALVVGLSVHEWAHARAAYALGDATAAYAGRMTLNPARHIDPFGALFFLVAGFGWARPVPIDPRRLGPRGTLLVAAAGPGSNIALAALALLPLRVGLIGAGSLLAAFLAFFALLNVLLAVFNSLPIPPLDGWRVVMGLASRDLAARLQGFESVSFMFLMAVIVLGSAMGIPILSRVVSPFVRLVFALVAGPELAAQYGW